jgi:mRNA interferase RelE/StbE
MRVFTVKPVDKQIKKLPNYIKKKVEKQFGLLSKDMYHPSLRTKKMIGIPAYEARLDYQYRFTFIVENDSIFIISIGMHDSGLGKK